MAKIETTGSVKRGRGRPPKPLNGFSHEARPAVDELEEPDDEPVEIIALRKRLAAIEEMQGADKVHYIYRHEGSGSQTKKVQVARLDNVDELDPHDIGMAYGDGTYSVLVHWRRADGSNGDLMYPIIRLGKEYAKPSAHVVLNSGIPAAATPAAPAISERERMTEMMSMMKELFGMVKETMPAHSDSPVTPAVGTLIKNMTAIMEANSAMVTSQVPQMLMQLLAGFLGRGNAPAAAPGAATDPMAMLGPLLGELAKMVPAAAPGAAAK